MSRFGLWGVHGLIVAFPKRGNHNDTNTFGGYFAGWFCKAHNRSCERLRAKYSCETNFKAEVSGITLTGHLHNIRQFKFQSRTVYTYTWGAL